MAKAQKGDLIRIVKATFSKGKYKNGDILEVVRRVGSDDCGVFVADGDSTFIYDSEYEIHRKAGEEGAPLKINPTATVYYEGKPIMTAEPLILSGESDAVNSPNHYTQGRFETIEIIEEITQGYDDGYVAYCVGNALKYLARAPYKHGEPTEDISKAAKYIEFALARLQTDVEITQLRTKSIE